MLQSTVQRVCSLNQESAAILQDQVHAGGRILPLPYSEMEMSPETLFNHVLMTQSLNSPELVWAVAEDKVYTFSFAECFCIPLMVQGLF